MRFVVYGIFFNPLVIAVVDWMVWWKLSFATLVAIMALPMLVVATMGRDDKFPHKGLWNYLAGLQVFYASVVGGALVIMDGVGGGGEYMVAAGILLLLPALVIASMVALS